MAQIAHLPGRDIAFEIDGAGRETVLLVHGLGSQLIDWDPALVHRLVAGGYRVIRLDNRDAGESTHFNGKVALGNVRRRIARKAAVDVPYRLGDMADDAFALLDHLDVDATHVIGISMGGYIAQEMAILQPARVRSLTSIMSSTGAKGVGQPTRKGNRALFRAPAADPSGAVDDMLEARRILATEATFEEAAEREKIRRAVSRAYDPAGTGRQLAAIWASRDRTPFLRKLNVPTLVIHGSDDHLVGVSGGVATAAAIDGSHLEIIHGMGHDLPPKFWGRIVGSIVTHLDRAAGTPTGIRIVPADPADATTYAELCRRAFAPDAERYGSGPPGLDDPDEQAEILNRGHCHGVESDGVLIGGLYMFAQGEQRWILGSIFVDPSFQRRGIGSRLMEFAPVGHPGVRRITLDTPYRNFHLHRFYESHGYTKIGTTTPGDHPEATDPQFHLFIYQRDFAPTAG